VRKERGQRNKVQTGRKGRSWEGGRLAEVQKLINLKDETSETLESGKGEESYKDINDGERKTFTEKGGARG